MSLIALPPVDQDIETPAGDEIEAGPFWPSQSTAAIRALAQIGGEASDVRLREAVLNAIITANRATTTWRASQVAAGHTALADVPADEIGGESVKVILFRRAVAAFVRADLAEVSRDFDATASGDNRSERLEEVINDQRRNALWALADMMDKPRSRVALI